MSCALAAPPHVLSYSQHSRLVRLFWVLAHVKRLQYAYLYDFATEVPNRIDEVPNLPEM
jgi:hypothetical protein